MPLGLQVTVQTDDECGRQLEARRTRWVFISRTIPPSLPHHAEASGPGGAAVIAKLSEALFAETLRRYIAQLPHTKTGWLAGVRDPDVGKTLALLHREPARPWTIATLAAEVGISRSVLAERFQHFLADTPIGYLTRWRLHLAARLLSSTSKSAT